MPIGINLWGKQATQEAASESAKDRAREWQRRLRGEVRTVERGIRQIERDEEKIKRDIKNMANKGGDKSNIQTLAKSLVRSGRAKARLYTARANLSAAASELQNMAATMRLADQMKTSTSIMQQVNSLVKIPDIQESMQAMQKEMMKAGLIEDMIDEGMEELDGPDLEEEAAAEVDKVLEDLAIDASLRMQIASPAGEPAAVAQPTPAVAAAAARPAAAAVAAGS